MTAESDDHIIRQARGHGPGREVFARGPHRRAGELSRLVLEALERAGRPLTPGELLDGLQTAGAASLAYTTVGTILSRLYTQGVADRSRAGRAYAYMAPAGQAQLAARRMHRLLDAEDDRSEVLASFVGVLSARDERILRELLGPDNGARPPRAGQRLDH